MSNRLVRALSRRRDLAITLYWGQVPRFAQAGLGAICGCALILPGWLKSRPEGRRSELGVQNPRQPRRDEEHQIKRLDQFDLRTQAPGDEALSEDPTAGRAGGIFAWPSRTHFASI
jgi:hypothetical protein